jgi:hypothetical protein
MCVIIMPGIQLFQTAIDDSLFIQAALECGCWLVPDIEFTSAEASRLQTLGDFQAALRMTRHFYILNESICNGPIVLRAVVKEGTPIHYVSAAVGTPSIEFLAGGLFRDPTTEAQRIRSGFLEFSSTFWTQDQTHKLPSPPPVKALYERLASGIKKRSSKIKPGKSTFWLGSDALNHLHSGARLVGYEKWLPTQ